MKPGITISEIGERWPSGDYVVVAIVPIESVDLVARLGAELHAGIEEGLGPWIGIGIRLVSGDPIEFVQYENAPEPKGFEVRVDTESKAEKVLMEALNILQSDLGKLTWVSECIDA